MASNRRLKMINNGVNYYNIEEEKKNKEKDIPMSASPLSSSGRTSSLVAEEVLSEGSLDPAEKRSGIDSLREEEAPPIAQDDVERAIVQLFVNDNSARNIRIRLNLHDKENVEFIARLQPKSVIYNFLKCTGDYKEQARHWFVTLRSWVKQNYEVTPRQGKFHLNTGAYHKTLKQVQVEPQCYASVWYDKEEKLYRASLCIYDFFLEDIVLDDSYITDKQKDTNVRGQHLYINPTHDKRKRPLTWAEQRRQRNA